MDYQTPNRKNPFVAASLLMGILSIISFCTVIFPLIFGSLGILFAVLGHRKGQKMEADALIGVITSSIGCGIMVVVMTIALVQFPAMMADSEYREQLNEAVEMIYGESYEEMLEELGYE